MDKLKRILCFNKSLIHNMRGIRCVICNTLFYALNYIYLILHYKYTSYIYYVQYNVVLPIPLIFFFFFYLGLKKKIKIKFRIKLLERVCLIFVI